MNSRAVTISAKLCCFHINFFTQ